MCLFVWESDRQCLLLLIGAALEPEVAAEEDDEGEDAH